jgi:putative transposase
MSALEAAPPWLPVQRICAAFDVPRHVAYPDRRRRTPVETPRSQPRALSPEQQAAVIDALHSPALCDMSPRQAHAKLLETGTVLASVSTFYRLLRARGETVERRLQRLPQRHAKPQLTATAPHQVWTWDITKLPTQVRGVYLCLYVIIDLYTRYVVGWMISRKENAGLANHLFQRVITNYAIAGGLIVHSDRGPPMISHSYADMLASFGVERSHSRPRTSNDNAFSEAQFKTVKYAPSYPGRFDDVDHARGWVRAFIDHYNNHRPHEGLAMLTPAQVLQGQVDEVVRARQDALDAHYARHPERYVKGRPIARRPPAAVHINPDHALPADTLLATASGLRRQAAHDDASLPEVVM